MTTFHPYTWTLEAFPCTAKKIAVFSGGGEGKILADSDETHMSDSVLDEKSKSVLLFALQSSLLPLQAKNRLRTHFFHSGAKTKPATEKLTPPQDSAHSTYPPTQVSAKSVTKRYTSIFNIMKFAVFYLHTIVRPCRGGGRFFTLTPTLTLTLTSHLDPNSDPDFILSA